MPLFNGGIRLPLPPLAFRTLRRMWKARLPLNKRIAAAVLPGQMPKILQVLQPTYGKTVAFNTRQGGKFIGRTFARALAKEGLGESATMAGAAGIERAMSLGGIPSHGAAIAGIAAIDAWRKLHEARKFAKLPVWRRAAITLGKDYRTHSTAVGTGLVSAGLGSMYGRHRERAHQRQKAREALKVVRREPIPLKVVVRRANLPQRRQVIKTAI